MTDGPTLTQSAPLTRDELERKMVRIKLNYYSGFVRREDAWFLIGALEAAWKERGDAIKERGELRETVKVLSERLADMAVERDGLKRRANETYSGSDRKPHPFPY